MEKANDGIITRLNGAMPDAKSCPMEQKATYKPMSYKEYKAKQLSDPEFRAEYDALVPECSEHSKASQP